MTDSDILVSSVRQNHLTTRDKGGRTRLEEGKPLVTLVICADAGGQPRTCRRPRPDVVLLPRPGSPVFFWGLDRGLTGLFWVFTCVRERKKGEKERELVIRVLLVSDW